MSATDCGFEAGMQPCLDKIDTQMQDAQNDIRNLSGSPDVDLLRLNIQKWLDDYTTEKTVCANSNRDDDCDYAATQLSTAQSWVHHYLADGPS
ncbi:hypothetical protein [Tsukamurella soli]